MAAMSRNSPPIACRKVPRNVVGTDGMKAGPCQITRQCARSPQVASVRAKGSQTVGFTADFLPRILPRGRILLSYQIQLSSLISLTTVSSGGSTIQVPDIQTQSDAQSVVLKSGQTLVMAGFGQTRRTHGVGVGLLSGYRQHDGSRTELVIMIHIAEVRS